LIKKADKEMKKIIIYLIVILLSNPFYTLIAQKYSSNAFTDSSHILIGDHLLLHLSFTGDLKTKVLFPQLKDTCLSGFEIIEQAAITTDTIKNRITYHQNILLTAFDSGIYIIPTFQFYTTDSTLLSETAPLQITVHTVVIDSSSVIKGIKPPLKVPLTWKEILPYLLISISVMAVIALLIFLLLRIKKKKPILPFIKEKPKTPAHLVALKALEALRLKKLWQQGEYKHYYSELTDILRQYLENRWNIQAMEMVSNEIIDALNKQNTEQELIQKIQYTLSHADSVKFAKGQPVSDENQLSFDNVVYFVQETKLIEESKENTKEK